MMRTAQAQVIPQVSFCIASFGGVPDHAARTTTCKGLIVQTERQVNANCGPDSTRHIPCGVSVNHQARATTVSGGRVISRQARAMNPFVCELVIPAARPNIPLLPPTGDGGHAAAGHPDDRRHRPL